MLTELINTRQIPDEARRRWFSSADMDLIVWLDHDNCPIKFELCYDKNLNEKSVRCTTSGLVHSAVDSGEGTPGRHKSTPILQMNGHFDAQKLLDSFLLESSQLPVEIKNFIVASLVPNGHGGKASPDNEARHALFPLSSSLPQAGEREEVSLRDIHVKNRS